MAQYFEIHPVNPQPRLLSRRPTCCAGRHPGRAHRFQLCPGLPPGRQERRGPLRRIRQINDKHHLTLLCRDLSELANYARVDNRQYRLLKLATPGPYTFILDATKEVPRRVSHPRARPSACACPTAKACRCCWSCTASRCWPPR
jgi:hypothetical protein